MHPGARPHLATFTVPKTGTDAIGNPEKGVEQIGVAWVGMDTVSLYTRDRLAASGQSANVTHRIEFARPTFSIPLEASVEIAGRVFECGPLQDVPGARDVAMLVTERL